MASYTDLAKGMVIAIDGEPYEVLEANFLRMQQRKAVVQTKIKNLISGKVVDRNWQPSDSIEEVEIDKKEVLFIYVHRHEYWFSNPANPKDRFALTEEIVGKQARFLKPNTKVTAWIFNEKVIKVSLPIKMELKVIEAPPAIKGNTAQGGSKAVTLEGGAQVATPLFINEGDTVRVNTETGEYVERVEKG